MPSTEKMGHDVIKVVEQSGNLLRSSSTSMVEFRAEMRSVGAKCNEEYAAGIGSRTGIREPALGFRNNGSLLFCIEAGGLTYPNEADYHRSRRIMSSPPVGRWRFRTKATAWSSSQQCNRG